MSSPKHFIWLEGPLADKLELVSFSGHETLSQLFRFGLTLVASDEISTADLQSQFVGKTVTIGMQLQEGKKYFNGVISKISFNATGNRGVAYQAEMVPFFWLAGKSSDCRIFQDETTPQIVQKVFKDLGFEPSLVISKLKQTYEPWPYCVQHRETDFNFVSRLLEHEGISYYFEHSQNGHKMVLADNPESYTSVPGGPVDYLTDRQESFGYGDHLQHWEQKLEVVSGAWSHTDYDFENPTTKLQSDKPVTQPVSDASPLEIFDFPGEYVKKSHGDDLAKVRSEELAAPFSQIFGGGSCRQFTSGGVFSVKKHPAKSAAGKSFLLISVTHNANTGAPGSGVSTGAFEYRNSFACLPDKTPFRPARLTPRPLISGAQTAVVVGPDGEEIYTDKYGRVKVRFHWDRVAETYDKCSCWIRVAQLMAGKKWGFMAIPRIGQEVVVEFLEGDPDHPLIVGSVYNKQQMPAYDPEQMATRLSLKTNSSKGGEGFNEIMLEDKKDSERLFLHAQKDMDTRVLNDNKARILGNEHRIVGTEKDGQKSGSEYFQVYQDHQINVMRHQDEHVEGVYNLMVGNGDEPSGGNLAAVIEKNVAIAIGSDGLDITNEGDIRQKVDGSQSNTVGGDVKQKISGGMHNTIAGAHNEAANSLSIDLKTQGNIKAGAKIAVEGGTEVHIKSGASLCIESGATLTLKVGGNFININPAGVFIYGSLVGINSGGVATPGTGCIVQPPEPPEPPKLEAKEAAPEDPKLAHDEKTGFPSNA